MKTGAQNRVFLDARNILPRNAVAFAESGVTRQVFYGYDPLLTALSPELSSSLVTSLILFLTLGLMNPRVGSLIARFIRETTALRDLKLRFDVTRTGDALREAGAVTRTVRQREHTEAETLRPLLRRSRDCQAGGKVAVKPDDLPRVLPGETRTPHLACTKAVAQLLPQVHLSRHPRWRNRRSSATTGSQSRPSFVATARC
ncbi:hypothetical protein MTO96_040219 [Rhipicephalus appendiculatus]